MHFEITAVVPGTWILCRAISNELRPDRRTIQTITNVLQCEIVASWALQKSTLQYICAQFRIRDDPRTSLHCASHPLLSSASQPHSCHFLCHCMIHDFSELRGSPLCNAKKSRQSRPSNKKINADLNVCANVAEAVT